MEWRARAPPAPLPPPGAALAHAVGHDHRHAGCADRGCLSALGEWSVRDVHPGVPDLHLAGEPTDGSLVGLVEWRSRATQGWIGGPEAGR